MQQDNEDDVRKVERQFAALSVVLERSVDDVMDAAMDLPDGTMAVPRDVWGEMISARKAITDLAHDLAFGAPGVVMKEE